MDIGLATEIAEHEMTLYVMEIDGKCNTPRYADIKTRLEKAQQKCMNLGYALTTGIQINPHVKDN